MAAQVAHLPVFEAHYDFSADRIRPMLRMTVSCATFRSAGGLTLQRLSPADVPAIEALFAHGGPFAPDAFSPAQVAEGVFYGLQTGDFVPSQHGDLLAVAGTHLVARTIGIAAVGNIYTHPAHRGKGYSQVVTSAVTAELLVKGLDVVLNVDADNAAAIHVYEKLGYRVHCPFVEGDGRRRPSAVDQPRINSTDGNCSPVIPAFAGMTGEQLQPMNRNSPKR
jgi:ribosomal protein S18 acetylase RimI-like enzyme